MNKIYYAGCDIKIICNPKKDLTFLVLLSFITFTFSSIISDRHRYFGEIIIIL